MSKLKNKPKILEFAKKHLLVGIIFFIINLLFIVLTLFRVGWNNGIISSLALIFSVPAMVLLYGIFKIFGLDMGMAEGYFFLTIGVFLAPLVNFFLGVLIQNICRTKFIRFHWKKILIGLGVILALLFICGLVISYLENLQHQKDMESMRDTPMSVVEFTDTCIHTGGKFTLGDPDSNSICDCGNGRGFMLGNVEWNKYWFGCDIITQ